MMVEVDDLPIAADLMKKIAADEAEKASEYMRTQAAADARKRHCWTNCQNRQAFPMKKG